MFVKDYTIQACVNTSIPFVGSLSLFMCCIMINVKFCSLYTKLLHLSIVKNHFIVKNQFIKTIPT